MNCTGCSGECGGIKACDRAYSSHYNIKLRMDDDYD